MTHGSTPTLTPTPTQTRLLVDSAEREMGKQIMNLDLEKRALEEERQALALLKQQQEQWEDQMHEQVLSPTPNQDFVIGPSWLLIS